MRARTRYTKPCRACPKLSNGWKLWLPKLSRCSRWTLGKSARRNKKLSRAESCSEISSEGQVERRKARLVAQGCTQFPGIDFNETYASVARLSSIRLAIAWVARHRIKIRQLDVTAYLNGTMDEEVFMRVPKHYVEALDIVATE